MFETTSQRIVSVFLLKHGFPRYKQGLGNADWITTGSYHFWLQRLGAFIILCHGSYE